MVSHSLIKIILLFVFRVYSLKSLIWYRTGDLRSLFFGLEFFNMNWIPKLQVEVTGEVVGDVNQNRTFSGKVPEFQLVETMKHRYLLPAYIVQDAQTEQDSAEA